MGTAYGLPAVTPDVAGSSPVGPLNKRLWVDHRCRPGRQTGRGAGVDDAPIATHPPATPSLRRAIGGTQQQFPSEITLAALTKARLETFSDGVIAILITIMVLDLHTPAGTSWDALRHELPVLLAYVLSFMYLGIYWNNHHHMLAAVTRVSGAALWANLHLLFWLSLVPFSTAWMSEHRFPSVPTAVYGVVLLAAAIAYYILQTMLLRAEGEHRSCAPPSAPT